MVGTEGFEPSTPCTPCKCATSLRYAPTIDFIRFFIFQQVKNRHLRKPVRKQIYTKGEHMITQKELKSILHYDPDTGVFKWLISRGRSKTGSVAGNAHHSGYLSIMYKGKAYQSHRLAWLYQYGEMPNGEVDHINQDKSDNSIVNLREVDRTTNSRNMPKISTNQSGCAGVSWSSSKKKWRATIGIGGKQLHLGYYGSKEAAIKVRKHEEVFHGYTPIHGS
tara:strand:- start:36961 stop:37623 length:663 start_codon:yes stop_codon:yes gene_type:complete